MPITLSPAPGTKERSSDPVDSFSYEEIRQITNDFDLNKLVGSFQSGKVYRGTYENLEVVVKVWWDNGEFRNHRENRRRLEEEGCLKYHFRKYPHGPNLHLIGNTRSNHRIAAAVYNIEPKALLLNLIHEDEFSWSHRIRVALSLASVLEYFHHPKPPTLPFLIRNISAANILIDEGFNPFLFDFGMISGGIFPDRKDLLNQKLHGCDGYIDPSLRLGGRWSDKSDVFAYGVLLLCLITKRDGENLRKGGPCNERSEESKMHLYEWAKIEYEKSATLVDRSLVSDMLFIPNDGHRITKLALECVNDNPRKRPTVKKVVRLLLKLSIVQKHMEIVVTDGFIKEKSDKQFGIHGSMSRKSNPVHSFPRQHEQSNSTSQKMKKFFPAALFSSKSFKTPEQIKEVELEIFTKEKMHSMTNGFGAVIGRFQYGTVYEGMHRGKRMTVKVWEDGQDEDEYKDPDGYNLRHYDNLRRLQDELVLLQHPKMVSHSGLADIVGYCDDHDCLGAVYDLGPSDTVLNLLDKENFSWKNRMKVALEFASLLEYLHTRDLPHPPYEVGNIDAAHIMLDKEYSPKLFDFSSILGGIFPEEWRLFLRSSSSVAYEEPEKFSIGFMVYGWVDIFAFGILLICLITKRRTSDENGKLVEPLIYEWVQQEIESASAKQKKRVSFVHESLRREKGFFSSDGELVTQLAMQCVKYNPYDRPSMDKVVKKLRSLKLHKQCKPLKSQ